MWSEAGKVGSTRDWSFKLLEKVLKPIFPEQSFYQLKVLFAVYTYPASGIVVV